jgi:hypothetical protein
MPVPTIGNISLPESASIHPSVHEYSETLKGGFGTEPPERLIPEWPIPAESAEASPLQPLVSALGEQFEKRPWLVLAVAAGFGIAIGSLCVRR